MPRVPRRSSKRYDPKAMAQRAPKAEIQFFSKEPAEKTSKVSNLGSNGSVENGILYGKRKVEGLWKEDGTVIFISGDLVFRLYRGLLAEQSKVFSDMFSSIQKMDQKETFEGIPVIHVQYWWEDIECLLRTILDWE